MLTPVCVLTGSRDRVAELWVSECHQHSSGQDVAAGSALLQRSLQGHAQRSGGVQHHPPWPTVCHTPCCHCHCIYTTHPDPRYATHPVVTVTVYTPPTLTHGTPPTLLSLSLYIHHPPCCHCHCIFTTHPVITVTVYTPPTLTHSSHPPCYHCIYTTHPDPWYATHPVVTVTVYTSPTLLSLSLYIHHPPCCHYHCIFTTHPDPQ